MEEKRILIGRDKRCDLVIEDIPQNAKVSGRHATITEADDSMDRLFILEDHSTNGTLVNSKLVHHGTYYMRIGDTIVLGQDYVLDWDVLLPFFDGRKTQRKPIGLETVIKPQNNFASDERIPTAVPNPPEPKPVVYDETVKDDKEEFDFTGLHWLITIGAAIIGFVLGILVNS